MKESRIRVLIVDDSAIVRRLLTDLLSATPDIDVVGTAPDAVIARERIATCQPDVITLDIDMPRMDGITFLRSLREESVAPVIVVSAFAKAGNTIATSALSAGAKDVVPKPGGPFSVSDLRAVLPARIRAASRLKSRAPQATPHRMVAAQELPLIALGASTGGTDALQAVLTGLPESVPPVLVVQHIPAGFSRTFAERLNAVCRIKVYEAKDRQRLEPGTALIAPGDHHMILINVGGVLKVAITSDPPVGHQRPSVDVLFRSIAATVGSQSIGVILTGMGTDGALGLLAMKEAGATTIAQDESTSVIFGMPREAGRLGAAQSVLPLGSISAAICAAVGHPPSSSA